jgi:hypothetical protein
VVEQVRDLLGAGFAGAVAETAATRAAARKAARELPS